MAVRSERFLLLWRRGCEVTALACLAIAAFHLWGGPSATPVVDATPAAFNKQSPASPKLTTRAISEIRPGMRVLAENPELAGQAVGQSTITPDEWTLIKLRQAKPAGGSLHMELLRPKVWVALHALAAIADDTKLVPTHSRGPPPQLAGWMDGKQIPLNLPEIGVVGPATIVAIEPCPSIETSRDPTRRVVTGTFHHSAANLVDLTVAGEPKPLGVTDNHPVWSIDRQAFVPAGDLRLQERLLLASGEPARVQSVAPRHGPPRPVYNLEVDAQHVYYVGTSGVLVHNSYGGAKGLDDVSEAIARGDLSIVKSRIVAGLARPPRHHVFPQAHREWFQSRGLDIDQVTLEMTQGYHTAIHSLGWSNEIMETLVRSELKLQRQLTVREIWEIGYRQIREYKLKNETLLPYLD